MGPTLPWSPTSLQWGRDQLIAEFGTPEAAHARSLGFNGAAIN